MRIARLITSVAAGVAIGTVALAAPAVAATPALTGHTTTVATRTKQAPSRVTPDTNPSDGYCLQSEQGEIMLGADGILYECEYYAPEGGYFWLYY